MRLFKKHTEPVNPINLPDTYDPEHPESGATTAEYGMLAGGVVLTGGLLYQIFNSSWFEEALKGVLDMLFQILMETIKSAVEPAAAILPLGIF